MIEFRLHTGTSLALAIILMLVTGGWSSVAAQSPAGNWTKDSAGITVRTVGDEPQTVRLEVVNDRVIRVTAAAGATIGNLPDTMMVVTDARDTEFESEERDGSVYLSTNAVSAKISLASGKVSFNSADDTLLLEEAGREFQPGAESGYRIRQQFLRSADESIYGFGQRQDGRVDIANEHTELTTHNIIIAIPFLTSSRGYGLLWNNASISRAGSPAPPQPLSASFELFDEDGKPGGLSARYYDGDKLLFERTVADLDHQFLAYANTLEHPFPPELVDADDPRIEWSGSIVPATSGEYELKMYSSGYAKLSIDGKTLLDRWRMNWNPWFHNTKVQLEAGRKHKLHLDWRTQGGYFRLLQFAPQPAEQKQRFSIAAEAGPAVDYYFVAGKNADDVIAGYRELTGKATMLPKWAFGFWQSRERYKSQDELLENLREYRERNIPIDNIVLDWSYWPVDAWGSHDFDPEFFPDPKALVDAVHDLDARIMISVWPKFYPTTEHYKELNARGCMFNKNIEEENFDWIAPGYLNAFYDAFDADCRQIYWEQVRDSLNVYGFDAWWLDAVEPDMHSNLSFEHRKDLMTPNQLGDGEQFFNAYALPHAETVHLGERETDADTRSFILTRSGFGGIQRTGSAIWSGDIVSRWSNLREQIAAGISVGLSGVPYWTFDIGGFTPEDHYRYGSSGAVGHFGEMPAEYQDEWQELNLRWFQLGAFTPLFRSHGQNPYREIFNLADEGSPVYDSLVSFTKLRYRLMPYIYTLAGDSYHNDGTMMRGLVMDFPDDPAARDIATQYMFGPALLVSPVSEYKARSRDVYLPAGSTWYDFYSGKRYEGGRTIAAAAPLARMPIHVRAGAIVPTGPAIQHTGESLNAPLRLNVYTGADGSFEIYEDDGLSYGYENGEWSRIPVRYDDASGTVMIGERSGSFDGMARARTISIRWIGAADNSVSDFDSEADAVVNYDGDELRIERPRR